MKYHMCVFATVAVIALIYAYSGGGKSYLGKKCIQYITIILGAFLGLRTWWMGDLVKYHTQYVFCGGENWQEVVFAKIENIGLRLFFHIEYVLTGGNYQIALIVIAIFCMGCLGYTIYKYSVSPYWSYVMYIAMGFYFFAFSGLKQAIAMSFLLLAFKGIVENRPYLFYVMTLLAALFHAPALIFLPAYMIAKRKVDKTYWLYILVIFVLVFVLRNQLVGFLSEMYYEEDLTIGVEGTVGGRFIMMIAMLVGGLILRPLSEKDHVYLRVFNLTVFGALLQSFSMFGNEFSRLADYYFQFVILYVPFIFEYRNERSLHPLSKNARASLVQFNWQSYQLVYIFVTIFAIWYYYNYIKGDISGILDYKFFWEVEQSPWGS